MKKVIYINLAGVVIPIEEPAYEQLNNYIKRLKSYFLQEKDGEEIIQDMESRIAELFQEILNKRSSCITESDVAQIIEIMGTPEAIDSDINTSNNIDLGSQQNTHSNEHTQDFKSEYFQQDKYRKLYANKNDKIIGGVCGGIAQYLKIDPVFVRIAFAIGTIIWGIGLLIYLILWAWLPVQNDAPVDYVQKRLYRDVVNKKITGVCAGIANYFNMSANTVRLIALIPIIFSLIGSSMFYSWHIFPFAFGVFPTSALIYFILSAIIPPANTVKKKMEMHGKSINIDSIKQAYNDGLDSVQEAVKNSPIDRNGIKTFFSFVFKAFVVLIIGSVLFAFTIAALATIASLLGFVSPQDNFLYYMRIFFTNDINYYIACTAICLIIVLPIISMLNSIFKIIRGTSLFPKSIRILFTILFFASIVTIIVIYKEQTKQMNRTINTEHTFTAAILPKDTVIIQIQDSENNTPEEWMLEVHNSYVEENDNKLQLFIKPYVQFTESPDSLVHIKVMYTQLGNKRSMLSLPDYEYYTIQNQQIHIPKYIHLETQKPYSGQQFSYEISIPKNMIYQLRGSDYKNFKRTQYGFKNWGFFIQRKYGEVYDHDQYYRMQ